MAQGNPLASSLALASLLLATPAAAQTYDLSWHTVDGGGVTFSTAGPYTLGATLGQPDASVAVVGGTFSVIGGFWGVALPSAQADLAVTKSDGRTAVSPGQVITYTIAVSNAGPFAVTGATVIDALPAGLTNATWTCLGTSGATCAGSGSGSISDSARLPPDSTVTYSLTAIVGPTATGALVNAVSVAVPAGVVDPLPGNDTALDSDSVLGGCGAETIVVPDGRLSGDVVPAGSTRWFAASVTPGRSYSVSFETTSGSSAGPGTLTVFSGDDGCGGTSTVDVRDTAALEPGGFGTLARVSFTASGAATYFRVRLVNGSGATADVPLRLSWSETTLYSPSWSDNGAFDTFYTFQNTTGALVHGVLTLIDTAGATLATVPLTLPAGRAVTTNTAALSVPRNLTGTARLAHDGPPGAVVAGAAVANFSTTPAYVQAVKFRSVRESR